MQRLAALLLLNLISLLMIVPAMAYDRELQLPPCCRTHGKHHCVMNGASATKETVSAIGGKCPCYPTAASTPPTSPAGLSAASMTISYGVPPSRSVQKQVEALYRISFSRSRQKRGPPSLFL